MKNCSNKPPAGLSRAALAWWKALNEEYEFPLEARLVLEAAMHSFDRWMQARAILDKEGLTFRDKFKQPRQHPAVLIERDSKAAMVRALKSLGLDILPPGPIGRPTGT